jgi:hypothetical protein
MSVQPSSVTGLNNEQAPEDEVRATSFISAASGDNAVTLAWINALLQPDASASKRLQTLARVGVSTRL